MTLLLDRGGFGVALGHNDAPQLFAVFTGNLLPARQLGAISETDGALLGRREKHSPAIVGHPDVSIIRPAVGAGADCSPQVDARQLKAVRSNLGPPFEKSGMPKAERAL